MRNDNLQVAGQRIQSCQNSEKPQFQTSNFFFPNTHQNLTEHAHSKIQKTGDSNIYNLPQEKSELQTLSDPFTPWAKHSYNLSPKNQNINTNKTQTKSSTNLHKSPQIDSNTNLKDDPVANKNTYQMNNLFEYLNKTKSTQQQTASDYQIGKMAKTNISIPKDTVQGVLQENDLMKQQIQRLRQENKQLQKQSHSKDMIMNHLQKVFFLNESLISPSAAGITAPAQQNEDPVQFAQASSSQALSYLVSPTNSTRSDLYSQKNNSILEKSCQMGFQFTNFANLNYQSSPRNVQISTDVIQSNQDSMMILDHNNQAPALSNGSNVSSKQESAHLQSKQHLQMADKYNFMTKSHIIDEVHQVKQTNNQSTNILSSRSNMKKSFENDKKEDSSYNPGTRLRTVGSKHVDQNQINTDQTATSSLLNIQKRMTMQNFQTFDEESTINFNSNNLPQTQNDLILSDVNSYPSYDKNRFQQTMTGLSQIKERMQKILVKQTKALYIAEQQCKLYKQFLK